MKKSLVVAAGIVGVLLWLGGRADAPVFRLPEGAVLRGFDFSSSFVQTWIPGIVRDVTAYNVGVRSQTSENPCIGATGVDLCRLVRQGWKVCAANFVPLGTILRIGEMGEFVVLDRMNRRFPHRVDIAMERGEVDRAKEFGRKRRVVAVATIAP